MPHIKAHLINTHGATSHNAIILENTSTNPHTYYEMDRWKEPRDSWNQGAKNLIPAPNSRINSIRNTVEVIDIQADPDAVVNDWKNYWKTTKSKANFTDTNCAVAAQWFLTKYADIPPPGLSNLSLNHGLLGILWWPSFIPSPAALPGRVMSNAKFYLDARNHPEIANYYSNLFLRGCLLASGTVFTASTTNISTANSTATNAALTFAAGVSSCVFFKSWNLLSAKTIADAMKKSEIIPTAGLTTRSSISN